jgi:hypothetical protein
VSDAEIEPMLARAAEEGARRALSDVGLGGKDAVLTIHDMRSLLERCGSVCLNTVRGVSEWISRPFQAAAGIGVARLM